MKKYVQHFDINNNGKYLKTVFEYNKLKNMWDAYIVCANTKRDCNDCIRKSELSPKVFYGQKTGSKNSGNINIFEKYISEFIKSHPDAKIAVKPVSKRLIDKYSFVLNYGFILTKEHPDSIGIYIRN
ncbi:MAG: hypothetical protein N4A47_02650 [Clostridia bacterium]|jgi:hypothetical protein|nr:hypothetical protein [Clostridia bacterium]